MDKIFYNPELTQILNQLIPSIPSTGGFELYKISKDINISFDNYFTDIQANSEKIFLLISNELISKDLAILVSGHKIELTEKGRVMISHEKWGNYIKFLELKEKAKRSDLLRKAYWLRYESMKTIITVTITAIITFIITLIVQYHHN